MHVGLRLSSAASTTALHTVGVASCVTDAVTALNSQLYEDVSEEEGWRQIREAYQNAKVSWGRVWHLEDMLAGLPSSPLVDMLRRQLPAGGTGCLYRL